MPSSALVQSVKAVLRTKSAPKQEQQPQHRLDKTISTPDIRHNKPRSLKKKLNREPGDFAANKFIEQSPREDHTYEVPIEVFISQKNDESKKERAPRDKVVSEGGDDTPMSLPMEMDVANVGTKPGGTAVEAPRSHMHERSNSANSRHRDFSKEQFCRRCHIFTSVKKCPCDREIDSEGPLLVRRIREVQSDARKSTRIIRDSKLRLLELQKKPEMSEADLKELSERNELLLREMDRFDKLTRTVQKMVDAEVPSHCTGHQNRRERQCRTVQYDAPLLNVIKPVYPGQPQTGDVRRDRLATSLRDSQGRSKSEVDLSRKLSESYDMQERLVADNADLEVKRYILYKELMAKDLSLETCRSQIKRLQGEMKIMGKENALLTEKLNKNHPEGDAPSIDCEQINANSQQVQVANNNTPQALVDGLAKNKNFTSDLEKQLLELEGDVTFLKTEMDKMKVPNSACSGGGGQNTCHKQGTGPPAPPMTKACGVCPPCPAPCNPDHPPTPAEKEVVKLTIQLRQTEENFKTKVTECAMLRADLVKKKEELEKERCQHREVQNKLRELEMKFEGLTTHTNMLLGTKEQAIEQEVNVRALKRCYKEARDEIDELRTLTKEQNEQIQDYRSKYLQAQQMVEEQKRQMDLLDMDNTRISEQINLEIQRVKLKFQEKLQELAPIPDLLKATQMRLKDAQQSQAIAEHNAEQLARELNCAREKVHVLLHNSTKPVEKAEPKNADEKQLQLLQQRITQLSENNLALKTEVDRLKNNVIRMEEAVLANEKRLQEKMHECAAIGGELDRARDEAARALQRANERTDTIKKCLQTTVAELERQLAASRAQVKSAEKEREEIQCRMNCQIHRLNENFEQAQLRILGLQGQVMTLRKSVSSNFDEEDGEGDNKQACACKTFFNE